MNTQSADLKITIAGGGVMGIMTAYMLTRALPAARVTLCDPAGFPAKNASYIAGGMLSPLSELDHMPPTYLKAGFESIDIWQSISQDLGDPFEFSRQGSLIVSHDEDRHVLERFKAILKDTAGWQTMNATEIKSHEPQLSFKHGLFMQGEGHIHPKKALSAMIAALPHTQERRVDIDKEIKDGHADWVIDCRGIQAKPDLPQLRGIKGETLILRNPDFTLSRPVRLMHPRYPLYIVPRADNIFMIGATIIESDANESLSLRSTMELMSAMYSLHPSFGDAEVVEMAAGIRPAYDNNMPQIDIDGAVIRCNGLFRHGYLFAPIMARCVYGHITGQGNAFTPLFMPKISMPTISTKEQDDADYPERRRA